MATFLDSRVAPIVQRGLLPLIPFVQRPAVPVDDPRSAVEILDEIRLEVERQEIEAAPLLPPAPLPSLSTAFSRRRAIFGAVALAAAPVAALPAMAAEILPNGAASVLSPNDARLFVLADAYEELEQVCNAHTAAHRGDDRDEVEDEFHTIAEGFGPIEDEMAETPADTMAGVLAKARACQVRTLRQCAKEDVLLSAADDLHRLFGGGANV